MSHLDEGDSGIDILNCITSLQRLDGPQAPVTKLPRLDLLACDFDPPLQQAVEVAQTFPVKCNSGSSCGSGPEDRPQLIFDLLGRYARYISGLTGQDTISIRCNITYASSSWRGIIVAERSSDGGGQHHLQVVEPSTSSNEALAGVTDFSIYFGVSEQRGEWSSTHAFSVAIVAGAKCHVKLLAYSMPEAAIKSILDQARAQLGDGDIGESFADDKMSILNRHGTESQVISEPSTSSGLLLHEMFDQEAKRTPDRIAIEFLRPEIPRESSSRLQKWSYEQMSKKCDSLANDIRLAFVRECSQRPRNRIVPVFLSTSPELYISYLAILKAGYAFCPLPTEAPAQRLTNILDEIQPSVVLGAGPAPEGGPWHEASRSFKFTWLDMQSCSQPADEALVSQPMESSLAYLIYTSGSTGKPKGVQITHHAATASIVAHIAQYRNTMPRNIPMRWYQFAAPTFDPSIMEIFVTLCSGGTLCSAPREMTLSNPEAAITETRSTIMMATPGFASMLDVDRIPTLCFLWTMGETLSRQVIDRFAEPEMSSLKLMAANRDFHSNLRLCNAYGPTEAAINATFFPNFSTHIRGSIIGYPLGASSILVISPHLARVEPVPLGFTGELAIGGEQVSLGYLQRPDENSAAFVVDERFGRLYRTGDRGRVVWDTNGTPLLEYLGRFSDDQVKINGQRVELGEIESVLCAIPEIRNAVAAIEKPLQSGRSGLSIVACLVLEPTPELSRKSIEQECRASMASKLPSHMQPARYSFVNQLPRTSAGKADRKAMIRIAAQDQAVPPNPPGPPHVNDVTIEPRASRSPERGGSQLLPSLGRALQKTVGASNSAAEYLRYGLDSLSALRFLRNIKEQDIEVLSLRDVLHARSLQDLAEVANARAQQRLTAELNGQSNPASLRGRLKGFHDRWQPAVQRNLGIAAEDIENVLPTTAIQARTLLSFSKSCLQRTKQRNYIHHSLHSFDKGTDIKKLRTIWSEVLQRHDIYRTVFMPVDDDLSPFAQAVLSPESSLSRIRWLERGNVIDDVSPDSEAIISTAREAEGIIVVGRPAPVLTLLRSSGHISILLSILHALFDLGSIHLLLEEIAAELEGKRLLVRKELRLAVEAHFGLQNVETTAFWNDYLQGYKLLSFPSLTGIRSDMTLDSTSTSRISSALTLDELENRSRNLLSSPLSALQAAWSAILLAYTSSTSDDVVFGSVFADRADGGRDVCAAPTFSVVPTRVRCDRSCLNIDVLRNLTDGNARASRHLHPLLRSETSNVSAYDTTIALQVFEEADACEKLWQNTEILPMAHDHAVMIEAISDANGRICIKATYTDTYMNQRSADLMLSQLDEILVWILANPMSLYRDASNFLKRDKHSILNPSPSIQSLAEPSLLHTQFEVNARKHPDHTALECQSSIKDAPGNVKKWSYAKLNALANVLAGRIRSRYGDVMGTIIPILMDKQPELYLAVLGILKAGAAWSSIDTSSPAQRRQGLIARLDAKLLLVAQDVPLDKNGIPEGVEVMTVPVMNMRGDGNNFKEIGSFRNATPDSLAYLIWTSGTTGAPKGVPISHRAACASMNALQATIPRKTKAGVPLRCLQFSQHTFDVFVQDLFFTWGVGGTVISASRETMTGSFPELSRRSGATHAHLTPAFAATVTRDSCPSLEVITMIGEKLPQHVADEWGRDMKAYNTYGPAEATVVSTVGEFSGSGRSIKSSNIGIPLPSVSCYVLRDGKEVMIQGVGELALGGPQIAESYLNDAEKTSARFVRHGSPEKDIYLTGDVVRQLADGTIDFIGREDDLVKLGGIRVELSEISFAIKDSHKLINQIETCYICRSDRPSKAVVCFVATNVEYKLADHGLLICTTESAEIARCAMIQAQRSLPNHMIPSTVVTLRKIPTTSSAKVDYRALEKAFEDVDLESWEAVTSTSQIKLSDELELSSDGLKIRQCISVLSNAPIETIHLHSSLHSLGIDSLSAARFVQRLTDFGVCLNLSDILQSQTVHDILRTVEEKDPRNLREEDTVFPTRVFSNAWLPHVQSHLDHEAAFVMPTTPLQEGVLSESMLENSSYWSNHIFQLKPDVAIDRLRSAWELVSENTEALRTCFLTTAEASRADMLPRCPSSFLQLILDAVKIDWTELVVEGDLHNIALARANSIASHHQGTTFHQPPWAVTIISAGRSKHMVLTIHHSIHDAESINFVMSDLASAYQYSTVPLRHQMRDALSASISRDEGGKNERYWHESLGSYADTGLPSWPDLTGIDESVKKSIPKTMISETFKLSLGVEEVARATRTLEIGFSVLLKVAFGCLLLGYLETPAVVFAEILSRRFLNTQSRDAIGPLVASFPVPFAAKETAVELFSDQSRKAARSLFQGSPSGPLVRKLLGRSPRQVLYPAVFVFHPPEEVFGGEEASETELWRQREDHLGLYVEHDLALNVYPGDGWIVEVTASSHFMSHDSLNTFCRQFEALSQALLRYPDQPLLGLLDNADSNIVSTSESRLPEPEDHPCNNIPTYWLEHHAQHHPDWNAAEVATIIGSEYTETKRWSFGILVQQSRKFARFIRELGYRGEIIAMCTGRTLQTYAIIAGIFMSGNTYLPIDFDLPQQRKKLLLEDSNCVLLFTDSACITSFKNVPSQCSIVNADDTVVARKLQGMSGEAFPPPDAHASAYLLYTSGSTGKPKGVLISHRSLCGFIGGLTNYMSQCSLLAQAKAGVGKWLGLASRAFDVHLAEIFMAWRSGLTAVTAPRELLLDDLRLALTSLKITHACFVPSLLEQAELTPAQLPDFVFMTVGGEKLSKRIVDTWAGHPRITVVNAYGPTELAIGCSASHVVPNFNVSNIGIPYGNTIAHVLVPETLHYAIKGQAGELCFTGCLVGNGYLNRPDAEGFVENFRGQRMYRTGDMARMLSDGSLVYLGRRDDQTKLRGQRMELSEISESIRTSNTDALEVVTLLVDHPGLPSIFLVSLVSSSVERAKRYDAKPVLLEERLGEFTKQIIDHCKMSLPAYMVPDYVIPVDIIPLARISGKADVKALKGFFASLPLSALLGTVGGESSERMRRDLTPPEKHVAAVVKEVLKLHDQHDLPPTTSLFTFGLDSLNAVGLTVKLREIGLECSLTLLLGNPTVESIATRGDWTSTNNFYGDCTIDQNVFRTLEDEIIDQNDVRVSKDTIEKVLPCLSVQESTITATLNSAGSTPYINHIVFELSQDVDTPRLKQAWLDLINDAPILRTVFYHHQDSFVQLVLRPQKAATPWIETTAARESAARDLLSHLVEEINQDISDTIQERPALRLLLVKTTVGCSVLSVAIHHALYDGQSFDMMIEDLWLRYRNQQVPPRIAFEALLEFNAVQDVAVQKSFWKGYLAESRPTPINDNTMVENSSSASINRSLKLPLSKIRYVANKSEVTLATLCQCLFAIAFARRMKLSDILFGSVLSGRSVPVQGADLIMAPCITTIPQRARFLSDASLSQFIRQAQNTSMECLEYQHTSLRDISRWTHLEQPMFEALFSFTYKKAREQHLPPWRLVKSSMFLGYPLAVEFIADNALNALTVTCEYGEAFGTEKDAERFVDDVEILLTMMQSGEDPKISSMGIVEQTSPYGRDASMWDEKSWSREETTIKDVLQRFTGMKSHRITKNASFFHLGVESVSAIRLAKYLRENGLSVRSADVMRHSSIGSLGHHLSRQVEKPFEDVEPINMKVQPGNLAFLEQNLSMTADAIEATYYCTPLQAGMITATLTSDGNAYVHQHARVLPAVTNVEKLRKAWAITVRSLEILRTTFRCTGERIPQWIAYVHREKTSARLEFSNMSQPSSTVSPLRLLKGEDFGHPPFRAVLLHDGDRLVFHLTLHHALYDGISLPMVFDTFSYAYRNGSLQALQPPPFSDAAKLISRRAPHSTDFWLDKLRGYSNLDTHKILNTPSQQISLTRKCSILPETVLEKCKLLGVTLQTVLLAAYAKVLATVLGKRDVVFGHVVSGRTLPIEDCENIVGPLFNTVPLRSQLHNLLSSNLELMVSILNLTTMAQAHQHVPLAQVQDQWRKKEGSDQARLFDSLFLFQNSVSATSDEFMHPITDETRPAVSEYCLNVEIEQNETELFLSASCHEGCLRDWHLDSFLNLYEEVLRDILENPTHAIGSHPKGLSLLPLESPKIYSIEPSFSSNESIYVPDLRTIKAVLANISGVPVESIASNASIFALGLNSLSAITVAAECRKQGLATSVAHVLQGVTAIGISHQIASTAQQKDEMKGAPLQIFYNDLLSPLVGEDGIELILPALSGQTFHLTEWLQSNRTMYMPTWSYSCLKLDPSRLQYAWKLLQERHPILRTTFAAVTASKAAQLILKPSAMSESTFTNALGAVDTTSVQQYIREQQSQAADMGTAPIRLHLIQGPSNEDILLLTIHHALYDAWSLPILIADLSKLYHAMPLPPPPSWPDFVAQTTTSTLQPSASARVYWKSALHSSQPTLLIRSPPTDNVIPSHLPPQTFLSLPATLTQIPLLTTLTIPHAVSLPTLLLLSFARSLSTLTNTINPMFGLYALGRSATFPAIDKLAGPCLNVLPVVVRDPWGDEGAGGWVKKAREVQEELARRGEWEQSGLREVIGWGGGENGGDERGLNIYLNILWHNNASINDNDAVGEDEEKMFKVLNVGTPVDFIPDSGVFEGRTGLEGLDSGIAQDLNPDMEEGKGRTQRQEMEGQEQSRGEEEQWRVFVDIALSEDGESVNIGARIEGGVIGVAEAEAWLKRVGEGVREMLMSEG